MVCFWSNNFYELDNFSERFVLKVVMSVSMEVKKNKVRALAKEDFRGKFNFGIYTPTSLTNTHVKVKTFLPKW